MKAQKNTGKKSGQILIVMALLSTTLIIMFGMVVAVGHLVEAKINLQNAVDLAAMSGASWQARFLNNLSLVNYRLRQNYKFTLYDIYVTQSRFNDGWRGQIDADISGAPLPPSFAQVPNNQLIFGVCMQARGYSGGRVPGEAYSASDDSQQMCKNISGQVGGLIPDIQPSPLPSLNPILIATNEAIKGFSLKIKQICNESRMQNAAYYKYLMSQLDLRQQALILQMIQILEGFTKSFSDSDSVDPNKAADAAIYQTFKDNLISANSYDFTLEYLNPADTRAPQLAASRETIKSQIFTDQPIQGNFGKYFDRQRVSFKFPVAEFNNNGAGCQASVVGLPYNSPILIGLSRSRVKGDPSGDAPVKIPFGIALRATASPHILFWPKVFMPTLVAIGTAKPFGSRIGPPSEQTTLETTGLPISGEATPTPQGPANMSFYPGDFNNAGVSGGPSPDAKKAGLGHKRILKLLYNALPSKSGRVEFRPSIVKPRGFECNDTASTGQQFPFMCYALSPTLYEGFFWNTYPFPNDPAADAQTPEYAQAFAFDPLGKITEVISQGVQSAYVLIDRMDPVNYSTAELNHWHYTPLIGSSDLSRDNNKPVFFADVVSAYSSWSPNYSNPADIDPTEGGLGGGKKPAFKGRMGYQIKLSTVQDFCKEIEDGNQGGGGSNLNSSNLKNYCSGGDSQVFY